MAAICACAPTEANVFGDGPRCGRVDVTLCEHGRGRLRAALRELRRGRVTRVRGLGELGAPDRRRRARRSSAGGSVRLDRGGDRARGWRAATAPRRTRTPRSPSARTSRRPTPRARKSPSSSCTRRRATEMVPLDSANRGSGFLQTSRLAYLRGVRARRGASTRRTNNNNNNNTHAPLLCLLAFGEVIQVRPCALRNCFRNLTINGVRPCPLASPRGRAVVSW